MGKIIKKLLITGLATLVLACNGELYRSKPLNSEPQKYTKPKLQTTLQVGETSISSDHQLILPLDEICAKDSSKNKLTICQMIDKQTDINQMNTKLLQEELIRRYLLEHIESIVSYILPRTEREISTILGTPCANKIDYADLYHNHLMYPEFLDLEGGYDGFQKLVNLQNFHLQYHSYEHPDLVIKQWKDFLSNCNHKDIKTWLEQIEKQSKDELEYVVYSVHLEPEYLDYKPLSKEKINKFSEVWHQKLTSLELPSPGIEILIDKIHIMDGIRTNSFVSSQLFDRRSIISFSEEQIYTLRDLNIDSYWQPLTIVFEEKNDCKELLPVFQEAKKRGLPYIIAANHKYFEDSKLHTNPNYLLKDHAELSNMLQSAAAKINDPYNVFGKIYSDSKWDNFEVFVEGENYFFAFNYFLEHGS